MKFPIFFKTKIHEIQDQSNINIVISGKITNPKHEKSPGTIKESGNGMHCVIDIRPGYPQLSPTR